jgi:uncharacterized protein YqiB (DUF1249 family)
MLTDHLCAISWRARPRSFVGLMTLYESNYIRLGWLAPDVRRLPGRSVSRVQEDCPLELTVLDRARFTTTLRLSYLFEETGATLREPELELRVYHDARLAEASGTADPLRHPALHRLREALPAAADGRWPANMLLNKWLEYCAERGHRFAPAAA